MKCTISSSSLVLLLIHLVVTIKGACIAPFVPIYNYNIHSSNRTVCQYELIDQSYLPVIICDPINFGPYDSQIDYEADHCRALVELPAAPVTPIFCLVDMVNIAAIPVFLEAYNNAVPFVTGIGTRVDPPCTDYYYDVCLDRAMRSQEENVTSFINAVLLNINTKKCDENSCKLKSNNTVPGITLDDIIPEEYRCNTDYISELAMGRVIGDTVNILSPEQKFIRYTCYLAHRTPERQSLFSPFLSPGQVLSLTMISFLQMCSLNNLLSCKTLTIDVGGTKNRVGVCACSDYDAIEVEGKCLAKPLTPCKFKTLPDPSGRTYLSGDSYDCVKHAICRELDEENLKERFLDFYSALYRHDFIREFIMGETTHACDCERGYIPTATGHCISASTKPSIFPLVPLFTSILLWLATTKIYWDI